MRLPLYGVVFAISLLACSIMPVRADLAVYSDSLVNGWQNWSWCSVDFGSTTFVRTGSASAKVTYTGGWQGLYLHHSAFDTSLYSGLSFWINGGGVNGRSIQIQGLLSDSAQPSVNLNTHIAGGSVSGSEWRQVVVPLSALHVDNKPDMTGFWLQDTSGGAQPAFYIDDVALIALAPPAVVHLSVNTANPVRTVDSRLFGVNTAIWDGQLNTTPTPSLLKAAAFRVLRFPGGSLSDEYHWKTNTTGTNTWTWASSFDAFATVAKSSACQAFITVNYGTGTAQEAADWVAYANKTKTLGLRYWEIGNECYGGWESDGQPVPHDPYTYAVRAKDYITKMKAVDPNVKVGVVAVTGEDSFANNSNHPATNPRTGIVHNGWTPVMLTTLKNLGITPDFLVYHRYEQGPGSENDTTLLLASKSWENDAANLRQQLADYLGPQGAGVEMVCTENNSVYTNPGKQTTSLVNGLFLLDSFANLAQTEFTSMVWWDLRNGQEGGNNNDPQLYGWRPYGDYGIMSYANDRYPTYFAMKLLSKFAKDGDTIVQAGTDYPLLACYAVKRVDGTVAVLAINKSATYAQTGQIQLTGFTPAASGKQYQYGKTQDDAARTGSGSRDLKTSTVSGLGATFSRTFPPYSATVFVLSPSVPNQTILPIEDAYVKAGTSANTNFGLTAAISTRRSSNNSTNSNNRCAYLKFDLTSITSLPESATLLLTNSGSAPTTSNARVSVFAVTDTSWTETGITWNTAPGLNRTTFASTGSLIASRLIPLGGPSHGFDLTSFVQANLGKVVTLQIISDVLDNNTAGFKSYEATSGKPVLSLSY